MPLNLPITERPNYILRMWQNPCHAPWYVYVETALEPLGEMVLVLLTPQVDDIARAFARPANVRRAQARRIGRKGSRLGRALSFDPSDSIGKRLPGAEQYRKRNVGPLAKHLWLLDGVVQRALWWWLIADVTSDFFVNWTSNIYETRFCQHGDRAAFLGTGKNRPVLFSSGLTPVTIDTIEYNETDGAWQTNALLNPQQKMTYQAQTTVHNGGSETQEIALILRSPAGNNAHTARSDTVAVIPGGTATLMASLVSRAGRGCDFNWDTPSGAFDAPDVVVTAQEL